VIRVTVPREPAPAAPTSTNTPLSEQPTIVRLESSAPAEPQIVRITSPRPAPAPTVVAPAPIVPVSTAPVSIAPTPTVVAPISGPLKSFAWPQGLKSALRSFVLGQPFLSHLRSFDLVPLLPPSPRSFVSPPNPLAFRVTSPSTISDGSRVQITNPAQQPTTSILQPGGAPSSGGRVVFQPTPPQGVTSPTGTRLSHSTTLEPPFSPQEGTVASVILPSGSASQHPGRLDDATPVNVVPGRHSHSTRSEHSSVASGPIILGSGGMRRVPTVVHPPSSIVGRVFVIELERQVVEAEHQRIFQRNEEARR
jgi:hypothetical protein